MNRRKRFQSGTRVALGWHPGFTPGVRSRDTWHARMISRGNSRRECLGTRGVLGRYPGGVSRLGHSGHVAYSQCSREYSLGWALGTRGVLATLPEGSFGVGVRGHVALSEGKSEGSLGVAFGDTWHSLKVSPKGLSVWLSGHVSFSEGFQRGFRLIRRYHRIKSSDRPVLGWLHRRTFRRFSNTGKTRREAGRWWRMAALHRWLSGGATGWLKLVRAWWNGTRETRRMQ